MDPRRYTQIHGIHTKYRENTYLDHNTCQIHQNTYRGKSEPLGRENRAFPRLSEVAAKRARTQAALKRARDAAMAAEAELEREARRQSAVWSGASWAQQWARDWAQGGAAHAAST